MLTLQGIPRNIREPILGKATFSSLGEGQRSLIAVVARNLPIKDLKGYGALILACANDLNKIKDTDIPAVYNIKDIDSLSEGDVVEIFPTGLINVLYQISSNYNIIFVTSKCDCNCIMCPQPVEKDERNLTGLNLRLISLMSDCTEELALTGGEPTAVGDDLLRLTLACRDLLPKTSLLLLTNGRKFSDFKYTHYFSSLRHPNITIGIPLYGDNNFEHDRIMGSKGAFDQTIRGILNLASFNNFIEIRTVVHKLTLNRLLRLSEFIYRNLTFVRHIAFIGLETIGRARENIELLWVDPQEIVGPLEEAIHYLVQRGMNVSIYNMPLCLLPKNLWAFARKSISEWKNSFDSTCVVCSVRQECSGVFESGVDIYSKYLRPVR